ncbi:MAG: hypothetical protein ACI841_004051 [Planctomycetota bacterium]|jgi:hypothetical protein
MKSLTSSLVSSQYPIRREKRLKDQTKVRLAMLITLGSAYQSLGLRKGSMPLLDEAPRRSVQFQTRNQKN